MIILYNNNVYSATITGDIDSDDAFTEPRLSSVAVTTGLSSQHVLFTHTAAVDVDYACLYGSNLTSGATVTLEGNTSNAWTTPAASVTLAYYGGQYIGSFSTTQSYRYWRLTLTDAANTDTHLTIPWFYYGEKLTMPGMDTGQVISKQSNSIVQKSSTGQLYGSKVINPKAAKVAFSDIVQTDKTAIETFTAYCDLVHPFIVLTWEDNLDVEAPLFVSLTEMPEWTRSKNPGLLWNMTLSMEECF